MHPPVSGQVSADVLLERTFEVGAGHGTRLLKADYISLFKSVISGKSRNKCTLTKDKIIIGNEMIPLLMLL